MTIVASSGACFN